MKLMWKASDVMYFGDISDEIAWISGFSVVMVCVACTSMGVCVSKWKKKQLIGKEYHLSQRQIRNCRRLLQDVTRNTLMNHPWWLLPAGKRGKQKVRGSPIPCIVLRRFVSLKLAFKWDVYSDSLSLSLCLSFCLHYQIQSDVDSIVSNTVADLRGAQGTHSPLGTEFSLISCSFREILIKLYPSTPEGWASSSGKSWIRHCNM